MVRRRFRSRGRRFDVEPGDESALPCCMTASTASVLYYYGFHCSPALCSYRNTPDVGCCAFHVPELVSRSSHTPSLKSTSAFLDSFAFLFPSNHLPPRPLHTTKHPQPIQCPPAILVQVSLDHPSHHCRRCTDWSFPAARRWSSARQGLAEVVPGHWLQCRREVRQAQGRHQRQVRRQERENPRGPFQGGLDIRLRDVRYSCLLQELYAGSASLVGNTYNYAWSNSCPFLSSFAVPNSLPVQAGFHSLRRRLTKPRNMLPTPMPPSSRTM